MTLARATIAASHTPVWHVKDCLIAPDDRARYVDRKASEGMRNHLHNMGLNARLTE
jgi:hypothetical protein